MDNIIDRFTKTRTDSDIIYRPLIDGDIILFNRQPSLRPESLIALKCKIINDDNKTFKIPLSCTVPLNADFDGDECNIHIVQHIISRVELLELELY